jgi:hypothetical protein
MASVSADGITASYRYNAATGWNEGVSYNGGAEQHAHAGHTRAARRGVMGPTAATRCSAGMITRSMR